MEKKQFVKGLLLRAIPFIVILTLLLVYKFSNVASDGWWGFYLLIALIMLSLVWVVYYAVKNGKHFVINSVKNNYLRKAAEDFFARWDLPTYNKTNVIDYVYQSERDFDRTMAFHQDSIVVKSVIRDEENNVTGDTQENTYTYQDIKQLNIVDLAGEGSAHIEFVFNDDKKEYSYFDVDLARFLMDTTKLDINGIEELKEYYKSMLTK